MAVAAIGPEILEMHQGMTTDLETLEVLRVTAIAQEILEMLHVATNIPEIFEMLQVPDLDREGVALCQVLCYNLEDQLDDHQKELELHL